MSFGLDILIGSMNSSFKPLFPDQKFLRRLKNRHKPEEINLNMVTNKVAGKIRARELRKRELIEQVCGFFKFKKYFIFCQVLLKKNRKKVKYPI